MKTCSHKILYMNVHTSIIHHKVEDNLTVSYKVKMHLLCDSIIPLLGIYLRGKKKTDWYVNTSISFFIIAENNLIIY